MPARGMAQSRAHAWVEVRFESKAENCTGPRTDSVLMSASGQNRTSCTSSEHAYREMVVRCSGPNAVAHLAPAGLSGEVVARPRPVQAK